VWVTRDEEADGPLSSALRSLGLTVVLEPVLNRCIVDDAADAITQLGPDDWLVLTSPFAVNAVPAAPARVPQVAVVGEPSRAAALARGFRVELVSSGGDAASLFEELRAIATRGKVCYPRSSLAETPAPWPQIEFISPVLYETHRRAFDSDVVQRVDVVAVASPSAVKAVGAVDLPFASIGPTTSAALRELGIDPWIEATARSFSSLAEAIAAQANESRHHRA
jgi:uroporphyrinogen-III synthase